jgi:rhamnulokinase
VGGASCAKAGSTSPEHTIRVNIRTATILRHFAETVAHYAFRKAKYRCGSDPVTANFLAFDLGAESGRAVLGRLRSGVLDVTEICRFPNQPLQMHGSLHWDIQSLWSQMKSSLGLLPVSTLDSIGVDTWGVDYALLDKHGALLENPYHYRDTRTDGVMDAVFQRVPREEIYAVTGIQFLPFNTLYQIYATCRTTPALIDSAHALATIPDLLNYWLTGNLVSEYTNATTTQMLNANTRSWATVLLDRLDLPARLLTPIVEPGTVIGRLKREVSAAFAGTPVVAPACHDTGSAVAAVSMPDKSAFLSSGTWSLLGAELPAPVITPLARDLNFTNEGGVCGTIRLLKNIAGLWLLQACRNCWSTTGHEFAYADLLAAAEEEGSRNAFRSLFDPDHGTFLHPDNMLASIANYCRRTGQPVPGDPPAYTRAILESLAFKYRMVLESLEELAGMRFQEIRIMGGGSKNRLLNQFTADATGRVVVVGPAEATALGNIAMQMLATGAVASLAEARQVIDRSFLVERFEPLAADLWDSQYQRFRDYRNDAHDQND